MVKKLYNIIGSSSNPSEERADFLQLVKSYTCACEKMEKARQTKMSLERDFFELGIKQVKFDVKRDHDGYYYIKNLIILPLAGSKVEPNDVEDFLNQKINTSGKWFGDYLYDRGSKNITLTTENSAIFDYQRVLSGQELKAYDMLENFEKYELLETIAEKNKPNKIQKI